MTKYFYDSRNRLPNGLTLLCVNPHLAARLTTFAVDIGWLYKLMPDGKWVTLRKLSANEISVAREQAAKLLVEKGEEVS